MSTATPNTPGTQTTATEATTGATLVDIPLDLLQANPANLRRSVGDIKALTKSVAEVGIVVPLIVTRPTTGHTCWPRGSPD
jgi:hypothetical protein